jgi:hypothetical protein
MPVARKLFCFGYGYTADRLAQSLLAEGGWEIAGTTRDPAKRDAMLEHGIAAEIFNYEQPLADPFTLMRGATHILISTPPDDGGDPTLRLHGEDVAQVRTVNWVGYLSTTGVYGDRGGDWVDEKSDVQPTSRRGTRRARAEQQWLSLFRMYDLPLHIFRLAGIYGPGRSALDSVRAGIARRINKPGHAFTRVHIDDIVQTLRASMIQPNPGSIYNVGDDYPAPSHEVIAYTCELLGRDPPPLLDYNAADLAPITLSFYSDNKRIRNDKIKDELGVRLRYPTFREGMLGIRAEEESGEATGLPGHWFAEGRDFSAND